MRDSMNGKRSSRTIVIAAGVLSMMLCAVPASAASSDGSAGSRLIASGAPAVAHAEAKGKGKGLGKYNNNGEGNKHRLELPISWLHDVLESLGNALDAVNRANSN